MLGEAKNFFKLTSALILMKDQPLDNIKLYWSLWNNNYQAIIRTNFAVGFPKCLVDNMF